MAGIKDYVLSGIRGAQAALNPMFLPRAVNKVAFGLLPNGRLKRGLMGLNDLMTGQTGTQAVADAAGSVIGNAPTATTQQPVIQLQQQPRPAPAAPPVQGVASGVPRNNLETTFTGNVPFRSPAPATVPVQPQTRIGGVPQPSNTNMIADKLTGAYNLEGGLRGGTRARAGRIGVSRMADQVGMRPVLDGSGKVSFVPSNQPGQVPYGTRSAMVPESFRAQFPVKAAPNAMPGFGETGSGVLNEDFVNNATNKVQGHVRNSMPHLNGIRGVTNAFLGANMTATGQSPAELHEANLARAIDTKGRMTRGTLEQRRYQAGLDATEGARRFDMDQATQQAVGLASGRLTSNQMPAYTKTAQGIWIDATGKPAPNDVAGRLDAGEYDAELSGRVAGLDPALESAGGMFGGAKQYGINRATGAVELVPAGDLSKEDKRRTHDPLPEAVRKKLGTARPGSFSTQDDILAAYEAGTIDEATAEKELTRLKGGSKK